MEMPPPQLGESDVQFASFFGPDVCWNQVLSMRCPREGVTPHDAGPSKFAVFEFRMGCSEEVYLEQQ